MSETEPPVGHSFTPRQLRILKASVIIMGVLLVLGFGLLLIGIYMQATKIGRSPQQTPAGQAAIPANIAVPGAGGAALALSVPVPPGAELRDMLADQGRLILYFHRQSGGEIVILDLATGRETQRLTFTPRQ